MACTRLFILTLSKAVKIGDDTSSTLDWLHKLRNGHTVGYDKYAGGNLYCQKKIFIMYCEVRKVS